VVELRKRGVREKEGEREKEKRKGVCGKKREKM